MTAKVSNIDKLTIPPRMAQAAKMCLDANMPFALFAPPGKGFTFVASEPSADECRNEWLLDDKSWSGFFINFFANDEEYVTGVRDTFNADRAIAHLQSTGASYAASLIEAPCGESTERLRYISVATSIVNRLKREGGKTVLSRMIVSDSGDAPVEVARRYFERFPDTFRYLCFTQETGVWLGATPEVLADYTPSTGRFQTMALAGTMPVSSHRWSVKNIEEQEFVSDYIISTLDALGATDLRATEPFTVTYGPVKHLCTAIDCKVSADKAVSVLYHMSPTPAIAGYPRDNAIYEITMSESHSRLCYGGFVGYRRRRHIYAWVNLRCATVRHDSELYTYYIYAGGGLTSKSAPEQEWDEGTAKTAYLLQAVSNSSRQE